MKTNVFKYIFFAIVIILIGLAIYIIYSNQKYRENNISASKEIKKKEEITIGIVKYDTINPILSKSNNIQYLTKLIFNSLITIDKEFKTENQLIEECSKINPTTYVIKLKQNILWHNNQRFTVQDVIFTINNLQKDSIDSLYKENVKNIKKTEKIDDYTIKIYLDEEVLFFEYMLVFPILSKTAYEEGTLNSLTNIPIGTGEYKITSILDEEIVFTNIISNKKIKIKIFDTLKQLYTAFLNQDIDLLYTEDIEYEEYIGKIGVNFNICSGREFDYIAINNESEFLKEKDVRKALLYAIDKKKIIYNVYNNKYIESSFPLDYGSYLYKENTKNLYNVNDSRDILLKNGWNFNEENILQKNNKTLELNLIVNSKNKNRVLVANQIKEQLEKIGIIINILEFNDYSFNQAIKEKTYDLILTGNIVSLAPDLTTYLGENNINNYINEEVIDLLKEIKSIENKEILKEKYLNIIEIYNEDIPFIPLYNNSNYILYNSNLKGDLSHNWYNIYYNINSWYAVLE